MLEDQQQIGSGNPRVVSAAYRADGLLSELTYPNARSVAYTYDELDRVQTVVEGARGTVLADYEYIGDRLLKREHGNGTQLTFLDDTGLIDAGYDGMRRVAQLRHEKSELAGTTSLLVGFAYDYLRQTDLDFMRHRASRNGYVSREQKLHDPANDEVRTYDSAYRLVGFQRRNAGAIEPSQESWNLDGADNWTKVDSESRDHSSLNEIVTRDESGNVTTLAYDDNGNLVSDGQHNYEYDALNRLIMVAEDSRGSLVASYVYDALGRRIEKATGVPAETEQYLYIGDKVLEERNRTDQILRQYVYGQSQDRLVMDVNLDADSSAIGSADGRFYYHENALGYVYGLTDKNGNFVEAYQYGAFGQATIFEPGDNRVVDFGGDDIVSTSGSGSALGNPYLFDSMRFNTETGFYLMGSRYLDPDLGRFVTRDDGGDYNPSGATDGQTSAWIRVGQGWASQGFGAAGVVSDDTASTWMRVQQQNTSGTMGPSGPIPIPIPYPIVTSAVQSSAGRIASIRYVVPDVIDPASSSVPPSSSAIDASVAGIRTEMLNNKYYLENMNYALANGAGVENWHDGWWMLDVGANRAHAAKPASVRFRSTGSWHATIVDVRLGALNPRNLWTVAEVGLAWPPTSHSDWFTTPTSVQYGMIVIPNPMAGASLSDRPPPPSNPSPGPTGPHPVPYPSPNP